MKKYLPYILTFGLIAIGALIIFHPNKAAPNLPTQATLFVGQGCPHCAKVEDFIAANDVSKKVTFDTKEVWYNQDNALVMKNVWDSCGLNPDNMGVPLYWDGAKCYSGEVEIIGYFQSKIK